MEYLSVEEAKNRSGLRLVLTSGVPGPWGEAAKAVFQLYNVSYIAVEQKAGKHNPELVEWTGHRNAPIALYEKEPARVRWLEMLDLAQRLGSGASLVPEIRDDRMLMVGLSNEIAGEGGFGWNARLLMFHAGITAQGPEAANNPMYAEYQYDAGKIKGARHRIESLLHDLASRIKVQKEKGSVYLIGSQLTAADVYWAYFSNMLEPLPPEQNPISDGLRQIWGVLASSISDYDPILIEHRNHIFADHLTLPLTF